MDRESNETAAGRVTITRIPNGSLPPEAEALDVVFQVPA